jgi:hypothetical protein
MDSFLSPVGAFLIPLVFGLAGICWSVGVIVMLFKIWQKVKHLPG